MFNKDDIQRQLDKILTQLQGFNVNGFFKIDGITISQNLTQESLEDTDFSFNYTNKHVLHFTSLSATYSILKSNHLKASSLIDFKDALELTHPIDLIGNKRCDFEEDKKFMFAASFTPLENKVHTKNSYAFHWNNYAQKGTGCALEFEIIKRPLDSFSLLVNYIDKIDNQKFLEYLHKLNPQEVNIHALLPILACIKRGEYKGEGEVRLLINSSKEMCESFFTLESNIEVQFNTNRKISLFYRLPIAFPSDPVQNEHILKLHAIYFGPKAETEEGQRLIFNYMEPQFQIKNGVKFILWDKMIEFEEDSS